MGSPTAVSIAFALALTTGAPLAAPTAVDTPSTDPGRTWSIPLGGVERAALRTAPELPHDGAHGAHQHAEVSGELAALSDEITTDEFTLAAVSWAPDADTTVTSVAVRVHESGDWSEWFELGVVDNGDTSARVGSEPVLAPDADGVQARVETTTGRVPADLRIDLVEPGAAATTMGAAATASPAATGDEVRPAIVTRAQWGANESKVRDSSRSQSLQAMYVHHTAGSNTYTQAQVPAMLRSILSYHLGLGWPDIGYQFLVDRFGTVYEGRRGSIAELVVGAQAGGYNTNTIGVSAIGHFHPASGDSANTKKLKEAPDPMVAAVVDVLAWQAHKWNLDPTGTVRLMTGGSTGSGTRWKPGELTDPLPVIRGHRDTNITACPGDNLQALLPDIRTRVTAAVDEARSVFGTPPTVLPAPAVVTLAANQAPIRVSATSTYKWKAVAGAVKYQVVARRAPHGKAMAPTGNAWKVKKTTTDLRYTLTMGEGSTWTVGVRAINSEGTPGAVALFPTTTRPLPTKRLVRAKAPGASAKAKWKRESNKSFYRNFAYTTSTKGSRIKVSKANGIRSIWIIAPSGPSYGRVAIHVGAAKIKNVSLARSSFVPTRRVRVNLPKAMSGTVKITAIDQGKTVKISGLVLAR